MLNILGKIETASKLEKSKQWDGLHVFATQWLTESNDFIAWQILATALRNMGQLEEAIAACKNGIDAAGPDGKIDLHGTSLSVGRLWYSLAHIYVDRKDTGLAKHAFREAAALDPAVVDIWTDLGVVCMNSNDAKGAYEGFSKAVNLDNKNIQSLRNLGILYALVGAKEGVEQMYQLLLRVDAGEAKSFQKYAAAELLKR